MAYTTINKSSEHFNTLTWTGDGSSSRNITGVGFQPDWVWGKCRNTTVSHALYDAVRGASKIINSNANSSEGTNSALSAFVSDGFTVNSDSYLNANSNTYVAWNWLGANGTASNTDGSITSTVSANTTSGFSIVTWTGTGSNATIGHGLSSTPSMIIVKNLSSAYEWGVYHKILGATQNIYLDSTGGAGSTTFWNSTEPTSSVFSVGSTLYTNGSGQNYIAYCFAEKTGYSKFGSYTGNGNADGTFVYTGFKPAFVMVKYIQSGNNWVVWDNKRSDVPNANVNDQVLYPNSNAPELSSTTRAIDTLSNGFKIRGTGGDCNGSGETYIYMCFAEAPLVGTNDVTAKAR